MKTLDEMLRHLARPEVIEFAVATERLPCVKVGSKYEPLDDVPRSTDAIVEMLARVGGGPYVKDLEKTPAHWTTRVDGIGSVGIQAVFVNGRLQARFAVVTPEPARVPHARSPVAVAVPVAAPVPAPTPVLVARFDKLEGVLEAARDGGASDVHVVAGRPLLLRVAGELMPRGEPIDESTVERMISAIVPDRLRATLAEQGSCDFALDAA